MTMAKSPYAPLGRNRFVWYHHHHHHRHHLNNYNHHQDVQMRRWKMLTTIATRGGISTTIIFCVFLYWKNRFDAGTVATGHDNDESHVLNMVKLLDSWCIRASSGIQPLIRSIWTTVKGWVTATRSCSPSITSNNSTNIRDESFMQIHASRSNGQCHDANILKENHLDRIQRHQRNIHDVLLYWFGQYSVHEAQKKLWMISIQSMDHRQHIDADIATRFSDLLLELIEPQQQQTWMEWCNVDTTSTSINNTESGKDPFAVIGIHGKVAAIIVLDQLSRHILRFYKEKQKASNGNGNNNNKYNNHFPHQFPPQTTMDALALKTAQLLSEQHSHELQSGMLLTIPMLVFSLMPYRHASTLAHVQHVQLCVEDMADLIQQHDALIRRFRKATNRRYAVLQDAYRAAGKQQQQQQHPKQSSSSTTNDALDSFLLHSDTVSHLSDDDILEAIPFHADMTDAPNNVVYKAIQQFLTEHGIPPIQTMDVKLQDPNLHVKRPIVISLSGGVDSMVIASCLAYMKSHVSSGYSDLDLVAVHIDYANRAESAAEAAYVEQYCEQHEISFRCRRIDEVTRGITARDTYESISRAIRYQLYKQTVIEFHGDPVATGVMLGHHRGDLRENVLSNAHRGCGPLDLSGMTSMSRNDGVTLFRPLLLLEKAAIYDYAHRFGVPYFKDTTPHWSTRGKIRNKLLPLLEEIYGEGCLNHLSELAVESDACRTMIQQVALDPFFQQVCRTPMGIHFATAPWKSYGIYFFKFVLRETLHSTGLGMFTDKSVASFCDRVQANPRREGWLQCRKDYAVYLQSDGRIFVFYPRSFPFAKQHQYKTKIEAIPYGADHAAQVGPWKVMACLVDKSSVDENKKREMLEKRAVHSMFELMQGSLEYYLEIPVLSNETMTRTRPLIFTKFTKITRPRAWKSVDLRIQETLPILGNDDVALEAIRSCQYDDTDLVHVTLMLMNNGATTSESRNGNS